MNKKNIWNWAVAASFIVMTVFYILVARPLVEHESLLSTRFWGIAVLRVFPPALATYFLVYFGLSFPGRHKERRARHEHERIVGLLEKYGLIRRSQIPDTFGLIESVRVCWLEQGMQRAREATLELYLQMRSALATHGQFPSSCLVRLDNGKCLTEPLFSTCWIPSGEHIWERITWDRDKIRWWLWDRRNRSLLLGNGPGAIDRCLKIINRYDSVGHYKDGYLLEWVDGVIIGSKSDTRSKALERSRRVLEAPENYQIQWFHDFENPDLASPDLSMDSGLASAHA